MIELRQSHEGFGGSDLSIFDCKNPHVLGYSRNNSILVLANFSEQEQILSALTFSLLPEQAHDLISNQTIRLDQDVVLQPYQVLWLEVVIDQTAEKAA